MEILLHSTEEIKLQQDVFRMECRVALLSPMHCIQMIFVFVIPQKALELMPTPIFEGPPTERAVFSLVFISELCWKQGRQAVPKVPALVDLVVPVVLALVLGPVVQVVLEVPALVSPVVQVPEVPALVSPVVRVPGVPALVLSLVVQVLVLPVLSKSLISRALKLRASRK
jgi:hypothetical protein